MKFGIREICDVVFRAKGACKVGNRIFYKDEPIMYFDTLKTSSLEAASASVYAQGGRGNPRLVAWDGDRTLTFNMEDALISAEGLQILSGAGLMEASTQNTLKVHTTTRAYGSDIVYTPASGGDPQKVEIYLPELPYWPSAASSSTETLSDAAVGITLSKDADGETVYNYSAARYYLYKENYIYVMVCDDDGEVYSEPFIADISKGIIPSYYDDTNGWTAITQQSDMLKATHFKITLYGDDDLSVADNTNVRTGLKDHTKLTDNTFSGKAPVFGDKITKLFKVGDGNVALVDYYVEKNNKAQQIEITADKFGGTYYIEGSTLFRTQQGQDMPAEFIIPNGKIQSNFTFSMAATGDPSTFTFTVDAMPDYTRFDKGQKVLAAIQIIEDAAVSDAQRERTYTTGKYVNEDGL